MSEEERLLALDGVPLTLLPVRLETRFIGVVDAGPQALAVGSAPTVGRSGRTGTPLELRIRVYPDQIHIDAHDDRLTPDEVEAGRAYWRNRWAGATPQAAWDALTRGIRPPRAAFIARATMPSNALGDPAGPTFPAPATREPQLDPPLAVRALPSRWVVLGYDASGLEILRRWFEQPVAPGLLATGALTDPHLTGDAAVDTYLGWTANYQAALDAGMAVTVKAEHVLPPHELAEGFARLVVLGVDTTATSAQGAEALRTLLAAHEASDGLGYLKPGTPTNNTDATAAGRPTPVVYDPKAPVPAPGSWSAAGRVGHALGIDPAKLARPAGAGDRSALVTADLIRVTWAGTVGHFFEQMLAPVIGDEDLAAAKQHAIRYLQPLVPLPTLRVGQQPLGLLPVVAPGIALADGFAQRLARPLTKLRSLWTKGLERVPRLLEAEPGAAEVEDVLFRILRRAPWTMRVSYRRAFGPLISAAAGPARPRFQAVLRAAALWEGLGTSVPPRILSFSVDEETRSLAVPLIGSPGADGLPPSLGYLAVIQKLLGDPDGRRQLAAMDHEALLGPVAAFAAQQELDLAAARLFRTELGLDARDPVAWPITEINGIDRYGERSPLTLSQTKVAAGRTAAAEVTRLLTTTPLAPELTDLRDMRAALGRLAASPAADVETALRSYLGACSHRIDAWQTSIASRQLDAVRSKRPLGTHVGGVGYVENLAPEVTPDSQGYVLGPSLAHATTAGILRSGYLAQRATGSETLDVDLRSGYLAQGATGSETLDVNLSSGRVQRALELMRGVSAGVPLTVVLGYRLERGLREDADVSLPSLIGPLRTAYPLGAPPTPPVQTTPPNNVTDAATLLDSWMTGQRATVLERVRAALDQPAGEYKLAALERHIDALADVYDALGDTVLAESVHQLVRGQPERAQAATRLLDRHEPPVEPDVTANPRTSGGYVQRCLVALSESAPAPEWTALADARAAAEPRLNAWLARLLGPPARWRLAGQILHGETIVATPTITLADLGLSALSIVVTAAAGSPGRPTELEERIAHRLAAVHPPGADEDLVLLPAAPAAPGVAALLALASAAQRVLRNAAPADAGAFALPDVVEAPDGLVVAELKTRADAAVRQLTAAVHELEQAIDARTSARLSAALNRVSALGVRGALAPPDLLAGGAADAPQPAIDLARDVSATARGRLERLTALPAAASAGDHQRRLATVFGDTFPVLGTFTVPADAKRSLPKPAQAALLDGDRFAPATWMTRMARVRPELDALWHLLVAAEAVTGYDPSAFAVVQLPFDTTAIWAALPFKPDRRAVDARVAIAMHQPSGTDGALGAFTVDAWTEQIPRPTETAGMAFHYDAPFNRAPQAAIVAVPPLADHPWSLEAIARSVLEAFDLTHVRGVTLKDLPGAGAVLPALYMPWEVGGFVPSVDLDGLVARVGTSSPVLGRD